MTDDLDMIDDQPAAPARKISPLTKFVWLVRRELWEHPSVVIAPAVIAGFAIITHFLSSLATPAVERAATLADPARAGLFMTPYAAAIGSNVVLGLIVGALYSLDALQGERRDRSILFWKSLPVSDLTTVLSKAFVPIVLLPIVILVGALAAHALMVPLQSLAWLIRGYDPADLWARLDLGYLWINLTLGLPFIALWYAPFYAWFLLATAWARRAAILWALAPFAPILMVEHLALHHTPAHWALERRLAGGIIEPYAVIGPGDKFAWVKFGSDIDWGRIYSLPDLWVGVALAALFLFVASRLRRSRPPL